MAGAIDFSLLKDQSTWLPRAHAILDEMISRGSMVASLIKSELLQLQDNLGRLAANEGPSMTTTTRSSPPDAFVPGANQLAPALQQQSTEVLAANVLPTPSTSSSQPVAFDFSVADFDWHDGLTAEKLTSFAESLDLDALNWITTEAGQ